jgi:hypothetical protein
MHLVVAWHNRRQRDSFLSEWQLSGDEPWLVLQEDKRREGCARTKNAAIDAARQNGADTVVVLDDDCFPSETCPSVTELLAGHQEALKPQAVPMFLSVANPPSRGTPFHSNSIEMPVAASMGFWQGVGDYDAPSQLVYGPKHPMSFKRQTVYGRYFPLSGMNLAFRLSWLPWCRFIDVPRFDDIWMGWLFQKEAYRQGYCFNLSGPMVRHSRQSNVWSNLRDETRYLEKSETLWREIALSGETEYDALRKLLPV